MPVSQDNTRPTMNRRGLLRMTGGAVVAGLGAAAVSASPARASGGLAHPGMLHTQADFDRMATEVKAGTAPYKAGYAVLAANLARAEHLEAQSAGQGGARRRRYERRDPVPRCARRLPERPALEGHRRPCPRGRRPRHPQRLVRGN
ncbi:hypothetical protein ACRAWF_36645 [Streptomyces sp. L7]